MRVKKLYLRTLLLPGAIVLLTACKPQGVNMTELKQLQERNAQLRQEIAEMQSIIRRAGEDNPELPDQLEARQKEVLQAYDTRNKLRAQETEVRMRRIELEGRLDAFRAKFQEMQSQIVTTPKPQTQP